MAKRVVAGGPVGRKIRFTPVRPESALEEQDRLTVILTATHEHFGEQPIGTEGRFSALLATKEQPYCRRVTIGEEWKPLDLGWITEPGDIYIENRVGAGRTVNPTEAELAEDAAKIVCVTPDPSSRGMIARPGRFLFFEHEKSSHLLIRCDKGTAPITIVIFPM